EGDPVPAGCWGTPVVGEEKNRSIGPTHDTEAKIFHLFGAETLEIVGARQEGAGLREPLFVLERIFDAFDAKVRQFFPVRALEQLFAGVKTDELEDGTGSCH